MGASVEANQVARCAKGHDLQHLQVSRNVISRKDMGQLTEDAMAAGTFAMIDMTGFKFKSIKICGMKISMWYLAKNGGYLQWQEDLR